MWARETPAEGGALDAIDDQQRCDELYRLVHSERWAALAGSSSEEVHELLGPPTSVETLEHEGHVWTLIRYDCKLAPSEASQEERASYEQGMRFAPTLLFRDGVCVPYQAYLDEVLGGQRFAVVPEELRFRPGGSFP